MSSESISTFPLEFQFPEPPFNPGDFNTESFKAAIVKNSEAWFKYLKNYHTSVNEFKTYYDTLISEAQQLQTTANTFSNTVTTLTEENATLVQHQARLEIQLEALQSHQPRQPTPGVTKSERLPDPAVFDGSQDKLEGFLLELRAKMRMNADRYP